MPFVPVAKLLAMVVEYGASGSLIAGKPADPPVQVFIITLQTCQAKETCEAKQSKQEQALSTTKSEKRAKFFETLNFPDFPAHSLLAKSSKVRHRSRLGKCCGNDRNTNK